MEVTAEGLAEALKGVAIRPPRLEDAGLEDCALPPDAIREAFARAAFSLKSRLIDDEDDDLGCVHDPASNNGEAADALLGDSPERPSCGGVFGRRGAERGSEDKVVVVGVDDEEMGSDRVLVLGDEEGGKKSCVVDGDAGLEGVVNGEEKRKNKDGDEEEGGEEEDGEGKKNLILVEDLI